VRLTRIEAENFRSHEHLDLDLSQIQTGVVLGPNGAGKSSILKAIEWALFGGGADEVLSYGADRGGVTVTIEHERIDTYLRISRGRERGKKSWLVITGFTDGAGETEHTRGSIAETQRWLEREVLGMDCQGFRSSVYVPQGEAGMFAAMNAGGRKALLQELLGLDKYEDWRELAASQARRLEGQVSSLKAEISALEDQLSANRGLLSDEAAITAEIASFQSRLRQLDLDLDAAIRRESSRHAQQLRKQLSVEMADLQARAERSRKLDAERQRLRPVAAQVDPLRERDAGFREQQHHAQRRALIRQQAEEAGHRMAAILAAARSLQDKQAALKDEAKCPLCGQPAHGEHLEAAMGRVNAELQQHRHDYKTAKDEQARLLASMPDAPSYDHEEHEKVVARLRQAEAAVSKLEAMGEPEDIVALRDAYKERKRRFDGLPEHPEVGESPDDVRIKQEETQTAMRAAERKLYAAQEARRQLALAEQSLTAKTGELSSLESEAEVHSLLAQAFSRSGIPAMMIASAVGTITDTANEMLADLNAEYRVRLTTQRAKKTGGTTDTLDILLDRGGIERPMENFSGGEKYRVNIALRMGLAAMMTGRVGSSSEFLLVDEPTDLDGPGMAALADVLTGLNKQVLLVTHHEELRERFPQRIQVSRASEASPSQVEVG
jgi:exonuclease SbcC